MENNVTTVSSEIYSYFIDSCCMDGVSSQITVGSPEANIDINILNDVEEKSEMYFGEHIKEAIRILKGR